MFHCLGTGQFCEGKTVVLFLSLPKDQMCKSGEPEELFKNQNQTKFQPSTVADVTYLTKIVCGLAATAFAGMKRKD